MLDPLTRPLKISILLIKIIMFSKFYTLVIIIQYHTIYNEDYIIILL